MKIDYQMPNVMYQTFLESRNQEERKKDSQTFLKEVIKNEFCLLGDIETVYAVL